MFIKAFAKFGTGATAVVACLVLAGCATSRSEISLDQPGMSAAGMATASAATAAPSNGRVVVIRSVTDERHFEEDPGEPSTPSLGFEGADKATAAIKARAIGRKRNSFGKAMGDILLEPGQTVESVVRLNATEALEAAGYQVKEATAPSSTTAPILLDIHIKKFWSWFRPGFWAVTLSTNIATDIDVSTKDKPETISIHAEDANMAATDGAWVAVMKKALAEYREQLTTKAKAFP
ncbi:hypothetical protein A9404_01965 [Halothiobacillus diazotrophicus]|uniref:Flagellar biosynthesis protein n=1 Tax=Halothiobacillus diazotrophicus TaxID=1860122 RepID=A0A191ZEL6_9GAMM|nr:hypothetical protein [Halothiobacillus diazotrophicus]ANJ66307.1 hypothetical protein A9404_01965 [Halothiobacillus diazotrophicus]